MITKEKSLSVRDRKTIWHPYTQHQLHPDSIGIVKANGAYVYDDKGKRYIDALSSWWTCIHGHSHPYIAKKVSVQLKKLEHVIFAGFTHEPAVELAERLLKKLPKNQKKIFFSDNGSTAVEVALKMSFQYWHNKGTPKTKVIAFKNAYHGDTFGAMSVSDRGAFSKPFASNLFDAIFIDAPIKGKEQEVVSNFRLQVSGCKDKVASFIFEPLVQGVAGMVIHEAEALSEMIRICRENKIFSIADEVFTGFGRTGKFFATDYLSEKPDMMCLSKGLTGGTMAMGVTSCTEDIFNAFLSEDRMKTFFHGHSFTANPVACSASLASMDLMERKETRQSIKRIAKRHEQFSKRIKGNKAIKEIRGIGVIFAIELKTSDETSYFNSIRDKAAKFFLDKGILLRPIGNVIYLVPPYCISDKDLDYIYTSIEEFIRELE
ncbi:MAG: adenosylmethionine--8-amino-7-oxononanoate transaminase [Bacteroidetes bacterium]|nr:MAG: adenosylmethionine--8-amino-7-oxononanoate transaminase [Bacteroidota bacterium]